MVIESTTSYFAYILLGINDIYYIKLPDNQAVKQVMQIRQGDLLQINGIGSMQVAHIHTNLTYAPDGGRWHEIGIKCKRVVL